MGIESGAGQPGIRLWQAEGPQADLKSWQAVSGSCWALKARDLSSRWGLGTRVLLPLLPNAAAAAAIHVFNEIDYSVVSC